MLACYDTTPSSAAVRHGDSVVWERPGDKSVAFPDREEIELLTANCGGVIMAERRRA
jgi:hypothetical protein